MDRRAFDNLVAADMVEQGTLTSAREQRYAGWSGELGSAILDGTENLDSLEGKVMSGDIDPRPVSGGQEALENAVNRVINGLTRLGAAVVHKGNAMVHVSGHASQSELETVLNLVRPEYFVPVHGEYRHLVKHAQLARSLGWSDQRALVISNGNPLVLSANGHQIEAKVETGRVFIDGKGVGDVGEMELRDRRHLANHGLVIVFLALNQDSGTIVSGPEIITRGFIPEEDSEILLEDARQLVCEMLKEHSREAISDWEELRVEVRKTLRRLFNKTIDRRPLILPIIMEL